MSSNNEGGKKPLVSLPFMIIVAVLAVGAYFAGPKVMEMVMLQQESAKANAGPVAPENFKGLSQLAKSLQSGDAGDPRAAFGAVGDAGTGGDPAQGGGFDPAARFKEMDTDGNGSLEGDEISGRVKEFQDAIDTDSDGAVTEEEFITAIQGYRGGGDESSEEEAPAEAEEGESEADGESSN